MEIPKNTSRSWAEINLNNLAFNFTQIRQHVKAILPEAKVLGMENHALQVGGNADLVVLDAPDVYEAIWYHRAPVYVIKDGVDVTLR